MAKCPYCGGKKWVFAKIELDGASIKVNGQCHWWLDALIKCPVCEGTGEEKRDERKDVDNL